MVLAARALLAPEIVCEASLPSMETSTNAVAVVLDTSSDLVRSQCIARPDLLRNWRALVFLYVAFSVLVFTAPSYGDWESCKACSARR